MDFECNFNDANFCQYSSLGWGFRRSIKEISRLQANENEQHSSPEPVANYYPCAGWSHVKPSAKLEKAIPQNLSQSFCLKVAYLLEEKGSITIKNGKRHIILNHTERRSQWNYITFPVDTSPFQTKVDETPRLSTLQITGRSACVDNFTVLQPPCSSTTTFVVNNSLGPNFWLTQPFTVLVAIIALIVFLIFVGIMSSFLCARKSQKMLTRSRQSLRRSKRSRAEWLSFQNTMDIATTMNSSFNGDTVESRRVCSRGFLPAVIHVRSNPQLTGYTRPSFAASTSIETNDSTPQCRFSLALTEDAQVQLLTNNNSSNNVLSNVNHASPPASADLSFRNLPITRQQSFTTTISHELSPSPTEYTSRIIENNNVQRPNSIIIAPAYCPPILDQSESDLSALSENPQSSEHNVVSRERTRPIRESMNIGYVSDNSPCDLPQYDAALELLAAHKLKVAQSSNSNDQIDYDNNNEILTDTLE